MISSNTALILIDVQKGFDDSKWGKRNNPSAETNISRLLDYWRLEKRPVVHVQHCSVELGSPLRPELPGCAFKPEVTPIFGEAIFKKSAHSAFIGTELESHLRDRKITSVVVVGLTTDHCVSTTTRMANNLGFQPYLVQDATATFDREGWDGRKYSAEEMHQTALASLNGEFARVVSTESVLSNMLEG